jgi:hypothetical protein
MVRAQEGGGERERLFESLKVSVEAWYIDESLSVREGRGGVNR